PPGFVCVATHILQEKCSFFYTLWILLDNQHAWWYIYSNQGIGFMSPFLFSCQFMSVNLLIYSKKIKTITAWLVGRMNGVV
ncbi:hypothetical protein ABEU93_08945, partial [Geobacillus stearothermophilus]